MKISWWPPAPPVAASLMLRGINSTGAYFFSKILDGLSTEEIIKDAVKLYETPEEVIAPSFERFIESLLRSGYLEKSEL